MEKENLIKKMEQQKMMFVDDLLKIKGNITIIEKKLERERRITNELEGRILQIEDTLGFLKTNNAKGPEK